MRALVYQILLSEVDALDADDRSKQAFREVIRKTAETEGDSRQWERVAFARHLLGLREQKAVVRDRLMVRYGVSKRHAYRIIDEAVELCHSNGTKQVFNETQCKQF